MKHMAAEHSQHLRRPVSALLRLMMAAAVVFSFLGSASAQTAVPPAGSGAEEDPYQITVVGNLVWMGNTVGSSSGKYYKLMNDIDASETAGWDGGKGFVPIGENGEEFMGVFDGNNKKITGLTINRPDTDYIGLFGITYNSMVKNLGLEGFTIVGRKWCGGLAGTVLGSSTLCVTNCYTNGSVSSSGYGYDGGYCGGLVGDQYRGFISNCYSTGSVSGMGNECGGLVGYQRNGGSISNCYSFCSVSGCHFSGGLVGTQDSGSISNCYATGGVSVTGRYCGGLVGYQRNGGSISSCYSSGSVSGTDESGGLVGYQDNGTITNCYSTGRVSDGFYRGGLVGYNSSGAITDCYYDSETSGQSDTYTGTPKTTAEMKQQATFSGWDFAAIWEIKEKETYPYLLNLTPLGSLQVTLLPAAAVTAGAQWSISGGVTWHDSGATMDGLPASDYTVTYKTIPDRTTPAPQTVTITEGGTTTATGIYIPTPKIPSGSGAEEDPYLITVLGNLVWMGDTVTSSSGKYYKLMNDIDASETAAWDGGKGFVPIGNETTPFEGIFEGNNKKITGLTIDRPDTYYIGLFGRTKNSTIKNLGLEDFIIAGDWHCGGLVGTQEGCAVSDCYSSGSVSGNSQCGGLVGQQASGSISNCYSTGSVSSTGQYQYSCGGLVGCVSSGSVSNCYATGGVSITGNYCGGLVGQQASGSISNCYSTGSVSGGASSGGLVGYQEGGASVTDSYYDMETSGQSDTDKGTPKTTAEMKQQATFFGWDFAAIWGILENQTYPYLLSLTPSGSLQVTILPAAAVTAGAQWSISGGVTWHDSGTTVTGLPASDYTVTYKTITGWTTPAPQAVTITDGGTTTATGIYVDSTMPSGSGTAEDPYRITVLDNLVWMGNTVGS